MINWLHDFFKNWAVAVEAVATLLLVIAAGFQWWAMRTQAAQERDRWEREDKIRAEQNKPKAAFGLSQVSGNIKLRCANLGTVSFWVGEIIFEAADQQHIEIPINFFVPVGENKETNILASDFGGYFIGNQLSALTSGSDHLVVVRLGLEGPAGKVPTRQDVYSLCFVNQIGWSVERSQRITCKKCQEWFARFSFEGITSIQDCMQQIENVKAELEQSCPNHTSTNAG